MSQDIKAQLRELREVLAHLVDEQTPATARQNALQRAKRLLALSETLPDLRTADEWLAQPKYKGIEVLDPDGWDRTNFAQSWAERISEGEFNRRLSESTCRWPISKLKDLRHE